MPSLSTTYLGLSLNNPVIASSSGFTGTIKGIKSCAQAGAGAVVLKSLFEEQIDYDLRGEKDEDELSMHPEAPEYVDRMGKQLGPSSYIKLVRQAKEETDVPIIASVNCVSSQWWTDYARQIEHAGADAIELNISIMPRSFAETAGEVEDRFVSIVQDVARSVRVPIAVKIGPYFSALPALAARLQGAGARGLVLFNRFYQLDIDIESMRLTPGYQFSSDQEIYTGLRWISILSGQLECELSASTGVHSATEAVKFLLAGAQTVQLASTIYRNGVEEITRILDGVQKWMQGKGYEEISQFRGILSQSESTQPEAYERLQYIKALTGIS